MALCNSMLRRPHHFNMSTHGGGELKTFMLLLQIDCCQVVCAEDGGKLSAVVNVMFEHMPDTPLARTCGTLFVVRMWEDLLKIGRSPASKGVLDHLPAHLKSSHQLGGGAHWLSLLLPCFLPYSQGHEFCFQGREFCFALAHPHVEPPDAARDDMRCDH